MTHVSSGTTCTLCGMETTAPPLHHDDHAFCCPGCRSVFNILSAKGQLDDVHRHPIFLQAVKSGLISNPSLLEQLRGKKLAAPEGEYQKLYLEIEEMWCPSCAEVIRLILLHERGVKSCIVDYCTDLAVIEYAPRCLSKEKLFDILVSLGYHPRLLEEAQPYKVSQGLYRRAGVAAFCTLNVMMFSYPVYASYYDREMDGYAPLFAWLSFFVALPVLSYSAWPIIRRFWNGLLLGKVGMEALVTLGVGAGFGLSSYNLFTGDTHIYFDSITVIITFLLFGKIIESRAKFSAKKALLQLHRSIPRRGRKRFPDGSQSFVPIKEIQPGDCLVVAAGERVVLDGIVVEGEGSCDESSMTGESLPTLKKKGERVMAGTLLVQGWLVCKTTVSSEQSSLQKIIDMIGEDMGHKSAYIRAADGIVRWFAPTILVLAGLTGLYDGWKEGISIDWISVMSVLLISCPCAIGIAAPLAESHTLNSLMGKGAIVRNRGCLPLLSRISTFVFDKTGTVTEGKFTVLQGMENLTPDQKRALKTVAMQSTHPIACAVAEAVDAEPLPITQVEERTGKGISGCMEGITYTLGSASWFHERGMKLLEPTRPFLGVVSKVYFAAENTPLTCLVLGDRVRPGMDTLIRSLPCPTLLLSGDSNACVEAVAQACSFTYWKGERQPLQKREEIESLCQKGEIVGMVGDGINDAPSLTAAHVGISVMTATDMSIQVSDILLTTDLLHSFPDLQKIALKGQRIVRQNLFWAFSYNVVGVGLAMAGYLSPVFAAFAMVASSLIVILNAQRLK